MATDFFLTNGELSDLFGVCGRTISRWIDADILPGYRLPNSKKRDRRVLVKSLRKFIESNPDYAYVLERLDARAITGRPASAKPPTARRQPEASTEDRRPSGTAAGPWSDGGDHYVPSTEELPGGQRDSAGLGGIPRGSSGAGNEPDPAGAGGDQAGSGGDAAPATAESTGTSGNGSEWTNRTVPAADLAARLRAIIAARAAASSGTA